MAEKVAIVKLGLDHSNLSAGAKQASQALEGIGSSGKIMAGAVSGAIGHLGGLIGGEVGSMLAEVNDGLMNIGENAKGMSAKLQMAGAVGVAAGTGLVMIGAKDKQAQDQLAQAITNTGGSITDYQDKIDAAIKTQEGFGHTATDTEAALQKMVQATGSTSKALSEMSLVANLAAAKHISLADAAGQVDRIMSGKGARTLAEFGITMGKGKDKTVEAQKALDELSAKLNGQAAAASDNFNGKLRAIQATVTDSVAQFGQKFGPAITGAAAAMGVLGTVLDVVKARQEASAAAAAAAAAVTDVQTESTVAAAGATDALAVSEGVALAPLLLIIAGVALFIGGLVLAYNKVGWFHDGVDAAMRGAKVAIGWVVEKATEVFGWLRDHWPLVLAILTGPFGLAVLAIATHWDAIKTGASNLVNGIKSIVSGVADLLTAPFRDAFNAIKVLWNSTLGGFSVHIPGIPGTSIGNYDISIPKLAKGGITSGPMMALIGDNPGGREAVIPLPASGGLGGGDTYVTVTLDGRVVADAMYQATIRTSQQRKLRNGITALA